MRREGLSSGMTTSFHSLSLRPQLLQALDQIGFEEMTQIQQQALPILLKGRDLIGHAKTGSGKTAAFGLALLQRIDPDVNEPQALVLCPTRELAEQVAAEIRRLAQRLANTRVVTLCGGVNNREQTIALGRGCHIVVGTPGRVGKHLRGGALDVDSLKMLVLDEADRMLDMGFIDEVVDIVDYCPLERQSLLFSATFPNKIEELSREVLSDPTIVRVDSHVATDKLLQLVFPCERGERNQMLVRLLAEYRPATTLVFCELRGDCEKLASFLTSRGATALALHGRLDQRERDDVMMQFANGSAAVLVATNLAARGLDIPALPAVINYEISADPESYVHRIGRTGRAGEEGIALTLVSSPKEHQYLQNIEAFLGHQISRGPKPTSGGGLQFLRPPNRTLLILGGRKDKLRPGDILGSLVKDGGVPGDKIGKIELRQDFCSVAIAREHAGQALQHVLNGRIKKRRFRARLMGRDD